MYKLYLKAKGPIEGGVSLGDYQNFEEVETMMNLIQNFVVFMKADYNPIRKEHK